MKLIENNVLRLAATDLSNHLTCGHLTTLDRSLAMGTIASPSWASPDTEVLQQLGREHEQRYLAHLKDSGLAIADLRPGERETEATATGAVERTLAAMRQGAAVIAQAALANGRWFGRADVLRRVETPSQFGAWSYEAYDCKLARETKSATILQLMLYSDLLTTAQGAMPRAMYVVTPAQIYEPEEFPTAEYAAYYRMVKARLEQTLAAGAGAAETYPEPVEHCHVCRWWQQCDSRRRADDHLSLVAGISRLQRKQLVAWDVPTMAQLAELPVPLQRHPAYGSKEGYVKSRNQARVQVEGREQKRLIHEPLEFIEDRGFARLPEPSAGDIFFDLEGDQFIGTSGLEYLFGFSRLDEHKKVSYECRWAFNAEEEKAAFEWFIDTVMDAWSKHPAMHVYHFTGREPAALKRLMGKYATREDAVDRMLRGGVLVDLHTVLKQSLRASVEEYSLKKIEAFYDFQRGTPLAEARIARRRVEHSLELARVEEFEEATRKTIEGYNQDDCVSTAALRDWLEEQRSKLVEGGRDFARPKPQDPEPSPALKEQQIKVAALVVQLMEGIPADPKERTDEQQARWLLANLLGWHRREAKAKYWEKIRLQDMPDEDLLYERAALAGLEHLERIPKKSGVAVDRYRFPAQDTDIRADDKVSFHADGIGEVTAIDVNARTVEIQRTRKTMGIQPSSIYVYDSFFAKACPDALFRFATWVEEHGVDSPGQFRSARDLLLRALPRLLTNKSGIVAGNEEDPVDCAKRLGIQLDSSFLAIQGPPGSGKTYTCAKMICELVRHDKKVGIAGPSHKVIRNVLDELLAQAKIEGLNDLICVQKPKELSETPPIGILEIDNNKDIDGIVARGAFHVMAGTAWLWAREEMAESVDVLFVDEAGQMSLANVLAAALGAKNLVLLGDPQQLEQPLQGSHPDGVAVSALEHVLGGLRTIEAERGLFMEHTRRLHPEICEFTSELFYDGRLQSISGLDQQRIEKHQYLNGSGLVFVEVQHDGNQNSSDEEANVIQALVGDFLGSGVQWWNAKSEPPSLAPITEKDILVIAPYNAQVSYLAERLPKGVRAGTVDKFQGQEAAVGIYSLTTSSPEEAPRGMEFLYSLNRLNVATSRGRALCVVVGNPRLLEPECRTPRQMRLANALCRFVERARRIQVTDARDGKFEFVTVKAA